MSNIVELQNVTKSYRLGSAQIQALCGVNVNVSEGDFLAVMGPSGSGKTSLLHVMGCVDRPSDGAVLLNGKAVGSMTDKELTRLRRETVGFVFQQFYLMPTLTALENVLVPTLFGFTNHKEVRAKELLEMVGLKDRIHHRITEISGGEMQRVAIARALINKPKLLLADEPTGNLDSNNARAIFDLFKDLNQQGLTVVVVTHNSELAARAKTLVRLKDGHVN